MTSLHWGVKASFLGYLGAMPDGEVTPLAPAELLDGRTLRFPEIGTGGAAGAGSRRFAGGVRFTGHGGVLDLVIAEPALESGDGPDGWIVTIADPYAPGARLALATVGPIDERAGRTVGGGVALTEAGADLFFGPYVAGTPLDDIAVVDD
ncbi:HtaA domain-containing protein [Leucobacter allii]|uniref:HtaA domain-containing protein n=1 Tax=Leucobacter allii TaxID=2932247 RepID=A0ABY4FHB3_9MICO|nr:HtaA domain-containing protein [Leucobacter allii]UOQ56029.1 HtaA domain-containing protein [Leucobacter allii]